MSQTVKDPPAMRETWVGKIPWRRAWQPTPVSLPGESPWASHESPEEPGRLQSMESQRVVSSVQLTSVQSLSHVRLFVTPWTAARQASLFNTNSQSPPKLMSIESMMPSNHLILCRPLLLLPSIFPSISLFK